MSLIYQYDGSNLRKETYNRKECLRILEILLHERDQIDTFANRFRSLCISFARLFSKNLFSQMLEIPVPPRQWIIRMIELLDAVTGEEEPTTLYNSDAYRKIWREASDLSLEGAYCGKSFCLYDFYSYLANK